MQITKLEIDRPDKLDAFFQLAGEAERTKGLQPGAEAMQLNMDKPLPLVCVRPLTRGEPKKDKSRQVVVNWTKDRDWVTTNKYKHHEPLTVVQTLQRRVGDGATFETVEGAWTVDKNPKGDPKKGFTFNQDQSRRLPEPGEYRLHYKVSIGGMPPLETMLHIVVQPAAPQSFKIQKVNSPDQPFVLASKEQVRIHFTGADDSEIKLSQEIRVKYELVVKLAIMAQSGDVARTSAKDFCILGGINVSKKRKTSDGLGFDLHVCIVPSNQGQDVWTTKDYEAVLTKAKKEGVDVHMGEPRRPMSTYWKGDRTKPQALPLRVEFTGCQVSYSKDGKFIFMQFPDETGDDGQPRPRGILYEHLVDPYASKDAKDKDRDKLSIAKWEARGEKPWPFPREWPTAKALPAMGEQFDFLGGKQVAKELQIKVISGGGARMVLKGPLV